MPGDPVVVRAGNRGDKITAQKLIDPNSSLLSTLVERLVARRSLHETLGDAEVKPAGRATKDTGEDSNWLSELYKPHGAGAQ